MLPRNLGGEGAGSRRFIAPMCAESTLFSGNFPSPRLLLGESRENGKQPTKGLSAPLHSPDALANEKGERKGLGARSPPTLHDHPGLPHFPLS